MYGLVAISLNAARTPGAGAVLQFESPKSLFAMQVTYTGSPSNVEVDLEGTLDGVTWSRLFGTKNLNGEISGGGTNSVGSNWPVLAMAIRAHLVSLAGGSSPTVTATIAAA